MYFYISRFQLFLTHRPQKTSMSFYGSGMLFPPPHTQWVDFKGGCVCRFMGVVFQGTAMS